MTKYRSHELYLKALCIDESLIFFISGLESYSNDIKSTIIYVYLPSSLLITGLVCQVQIAHAATFSLL